MTTATEVNVFEWERLARKIVQKLQAQYPGPWRIESDWGDSVLSGHGEVVHCAGPMFARSLIELALGAPEAQLTYKPDWYDLTRELVHELLRKLPGPWEIDDYLVRRVESQGIVIQCDSADQAQLLLELSQVTNNGKLVGDIWQAVANSADDDTALYDAAIDHELDGYEDAEVTPLMAYVQASEMLRSHDLDPAEIFAQQGIHKPPDHSE